MIYKQMRLLLPWLPKNYLSLNNLVSLENTDKKMFFNKWEIAQKKFGPVAASEKNVHKSIEILDLDEKYNDAVKKIEASETFQNTYEDRWYEFKVVEIDKMVSYENFLRIDFINEIIKKFNKKPSQEELIDICLSLTKPNATVKRLKLDNCHYIWSSDSQDFRLLDIFSTPNEDIHVERLSKGIPVRVLCVVLGYGLPILSAYLFNNQVVLNNGNHRIFALRSLGVTHVPLLLVKDPTKTELLTVSKGAPLDALTNATRPPLIKDFFNNDFTFDVEGLPRKRAIKISISPEYIDVPV